MGIHARLGGTQHSACGRPATVVTWVTPVLRPVHVPLPGARRCARIVPPHESTAGRLGRCIHTRDRVERPRCSVPDLGASDRPPSGTTHSMQRRHDTSHVGWSGPTSYNSSHFYFFCADTLCYYSSNNISMPAQRWCRGSASRLDRSGPRGAAPRPRGFVRATALEKQGSAPFGTRAQPAAPA